MKKILLATAAGASLLAATFVAIPAHADELPTDTLPSAASGLDNTPPASKAPEFKVDFNWTIPANEIGAPYTTCDVQLIRADGTIANEAPFPANIPTVTYKLDAGETHDDNFTPGLSTVSLAYSCFNADGDRSALQRIDSVVIPDVVPTAPAYVDVQDPDALYPTVTFGGSQTLGLAQLDGYQVQILGDSGGAVTQYTPIAGSSVSTSTSARGAARMKAAAASASSALSTTLSDMAPGLYTVQVKGKNAVGLSSATTTEVLVRAKPSAPVQLVRVPGHVTSFKAKATKSNATLTWKAPINTSGIKYSVKVSGKGKVKTYSVGAKTTVKVTGLKKNTKYSVRVTATGAANLSSLTTFDFKTKKR